MKTLYLLRHATPNGAGPGERDIDRSLSPTGLAESVAVGEHLQKCATPSPDLVLCSSAQRTVDTLNALRPSLDRTVEASIEEDLYCADRRELLSRIAQMDHAEAILVIAHNPGIAALAASLSRAGDTAPMRRLTSGYPPAALAIIGFDVQNWFELMSGGPGDLLDYRIPGSFT